MAEYPLALAINGRERQLRERLVEFSEPVEAAARSDGSVAPPGSVAIVGLGYVGLPTACALGSRWSSIIGIDSSPDRLEAIRRGELDLPEEDRDWVAAALEDGRLQLSEDGSRLAETDAVIVCVPTPVDEGHEPDLRALRGACETVVAGARRGQTIILASTTFVGTTHQLLVEPLRQRGMAVGTDIHVAFSPERIDPGNPDHRHRDTPRIVGGATARCSSRAARIVGHMTDSVYLVSSPEVAELTKLYENVFRAVNLSLANEVADVCGGFGLDPIEVTVAAGTKPYGFLGSFPGPGVGGHCIPCDPYYLLWQLGGQDRSAPLIEQAMRSIDQRPDRVVSRVAEMLAEAGLGAERARVLLVGVSYKAGVSDLRESPALPIIAGLRRLGVDVGYHDPLVPRVRLRDGQELGTQPAPPADLWDLAVVHTVHPGFDYEWVRAYPRILDATYQFDAAPHRQVV